MAEPSQQELEAAHCWWPTTDAVPGRPAMSAFRSRIRLKQARWREAAGHPIGTNPIRPRAGKPSRLVGSRLPLDYARETGATFLTASALAAAKTRTKAMEPYQSWDDQRLWAELLWPTALSFNLFGDLAADLDLADRAVHTWWPDTPGRVVDVRFEHSPGRLDPAYLGNLFEFNAAFVLDLGRDERGIVGVKTKYWERVKRETPKPTRVRRYLEIADRSGQFDAAAIAAVNGTDLLVMWLDHLLVHAMLQHPEDDWRWGRLVVVHPAGNVDFKDACARYASLLRDSTTFASMTLEDLLGADALKRSTGAALRKRYLGY